MRQMNQEDLTWHHTKKNHQPRRMTATIEKILINTKNRYNDLNNDELEEYGNYKTPWTLESSVSGHYFGRKAGLR